MANSVDPDQTAIYMQSVLGLHCLLLYYFVCNVRQLFATDDFSRRHFQIHFFLGALRVNFEKKAEGDNKSIKNYPPCNELTVIS